MVFVEFLMAVERGYGGDFNIRRNLLYKLIKRIFLNKILIPEFSIFLLYLDVKFRECEGLKVGVMINECGGAAFRTFSQGERNLILKELGGSQFVWELKLNWIFNCFFIY